jgi:hypothetical protein
MTGNGNDIPVPVLVLRIRDVYPGSRQDPESKDPGSGSASQNLSIFNPKIVSMLSETKSGMLIPDPDLLPIPDTGVKMKPDSESATRKKQFKNPGTLCR